jgi:tRNA-specific 2-thiouridylase
MPKIKAKSRVFVGLSGGVDSSVSAALLQSQGYDVTGVFIKVWQPDFYACTWKEDRLDAMRVCAKLKIPFHTLDLEKEYKKEVVDYMITEYKNGRTPNPDVMCNKYIKFGGFFDWAMKNGADYVATGHYARLNSNHQLVAGKDKNKDQSYFLWTLTKKQLAKTLFPVGNIEKPEVRKLAKKFGLPTAEKKDSQGLCFIGKVDMAEFLKHFIKTKPGNVLNTNGEVVGIHDGSVLYTIGQRHGFTITKNTTTDSRNFIVSKDLKNNTVTISDSDKAGPCPQRTRFNLVRGKEIKLTNFNWTGNLQPSISKNYQARIRYRQPLSECIIKEVKNDGCIVVFKKVQKAVAPGQSLVIYDGEVCLGGGIIL